jgi:quercetin dioxygenase-like cupin family protein
MNKTIWEPGEGKILSVAGDPFLCKALGADTDNDWSLFEATVMPGSFVPDHRHDGFEESFYILEGELEMQMNGESMTVSKGHFIKVPKGAIHGYRNTSGHEAKYLTWTHPAGIEYFYGDIDANVKVMPDDCVRIPAIMEKHQIELMPVG